MDGRATMRWLFLALMAAAFGRCCKKCTKIKRHIWRIYYLFCLTLRQNWRKINNRKRGNPQAKEITMMLNKKFEGASLYNIEFIPKGTHKTEQLSVWAKNRLDASNYLILHHIWGKQVSIQVSTANLLDARRR